MSEQYAEVFVHLIAAEAGGRSSPVSFNETYRPHFQVGNGELLGVTFVDGPDEPIQPGQCSYATVRFVYSPAVNYEALEVGAQFKVFEGPRIVGVGRVSRRE